MMVTLVSCPEKCRAAKGRKKQLRLGH